MLRIISRHIYFDGIDHGLSVAEFSDDFSSVSIVPFDLETAETLWIDGNIHIEVDSENRYSYYTTDTPFPNN